jgi:hypothetical protein
MTPLRRRMTEDLILRNRFSRTFREVGSYNEKLPDVQT